MATIKLDDVRNANGLTNKMICALWDIAVELHHRQDVKVAVFSAAGAYFCTGGAFGGSDPDDALYRPELSPGMTEEERSDAGNWPTALTFYLLSTLPQYKIASIRGANMGAGNSLIASMDFVVAPEKKCALSFKEAMRGLAACMSWQGVLSKVGIPNARRLTLCSEEIDAHQARKHGFVDEVISGSLDVALKECDTRALEKGQEIANLDDATIRSMKTTGPYGCKTNLLPCPRGVQDTEAIKWELGYDEAVKEVISKCGRSGRPLAAQLSDRMWEHDSVQLKRVGKGVAIIKLTSPETGNALDKNTVTALLDALVELHGSVGKVRLVCVHASGDVFCSGLDKSLSSDDEQLHRMLFLFWMLPMYVVGVVKGEVSGLGHALCCTFDMLVAEESRALFDFSGLQLECGGEYVVPRVGTSKIEQLINMREKQSASQAEELSIVHHVYSTKVELDEFLENLCRKISNTAPNAVAESKVYQQTVGSSTIDIGVLGFMCRHITKRMSDPEFQDALAQITVPMYKAKFNRDSDGELSVMMPSMTTK